MRRWASQRDKSTCNSSHAPPARIAYQKARSMDAPGMANREYHRRLARDMTITSQRTNRRRTIATHFEAASAVRTRGDRGREEAIFAAARWLPLAAGLASGRASARAALARSPIAT